MATGHIGADNSYMRHVTELSEPLQPFTRYDVSTSTPWGVAQSATTLTKGIVFYTTASHGGIHVSAGKLKQMPDYMQGDAYAPAGWFEEDCAWSLVAVVFPELFSLKDRLAAMDCAARYYPEAYRRFLTERRG